MSDYESLRRYLGRMTSGRRRWALPATLAAGVAAVAGAGVLALGTEARPTPAPPSAQLTSPPPPDAAFVAGVGRVLGWLEKREAPVAARLQRATTRADRVAAVKQLWWTYAGAASGCGSSTRAPRSEGPPAAGRGAAPRGLRVRAGRGAPHRAGYEREGELALVHQVGVVRVVDNLRAAGYELPPAAAGAARFTAL